MGALNFFSKSFIPIRCHLVSDTKSSLQVLLENALGKTRRFLRVFYKDRNVNTSKIHKLQQNSHVELNPKHPRPTNSSKSNLLSYRAGYIREVTSKWVSDSLAGKVSKECVRKIFQGGSGPMLCFVGYGLAKKPSLLTAEEELEGVSYEIREAFSLLPRKNHEKEYEEISIFSSQFKFSDLKIGEMIAKGCNAVVYSAKLANEDKSVSVAETSGNMTKESLSKSELEFTQSKLIISHSEGDQNFATFRIENLTSVESLQDLESYNLAVKVMFNYSAESNAYAIWRAMYKETLPCLTEFTFGDMSWQKKARKKSLKPHPNIIEMYFAFADQIPLLPGAFTNYPQALPTRLLTDGCGRNMTLFLVMKRYHCSLKDYLKRYDVSPRTALLLFTQILEALVHLLQNEVAHRDLKTDNILLDLSYGVASPRLVITDFGCCLESLQLNYTSPEIEKGGNMALMAPEVVAAEAGPFSAINYSRSDLWTAGTLAYEIFGGSNPFYSSKSALKNFDFKVESIPPLPAKAPPAIEKLVRHILRVNPDERPSQCFAATVCQILIHSPTELLKSSSESNLPKDVLEWMFLMSAETYIEASLQSADVKTIEHDLKRTFCSRIQYLDVLEAVRYIRSC